VSLAAKIWVFLMVAGVLLSASTGRLKRHTYTTGSKRCITVADTIRMTRIAGPLRSGSYAGFGPQDGIAFLSPDGKRVAMVLRRGNLENNTNVYSLWVFGTHGISKGERPRRIVEFASSSNQDGIARPTWLADNDTIVFLGARGVEPSQLYLIRCSTGGLEQLTHHRTALTSYAVTADGRTIVYAAEQPGRPVVTRESLRGGFWVDRQNLVDVIRGQLSGAEQEIFVRRNVGEPASKLSTAGRLDDRTPELSMSPNGRYVLAKTNAIRVPDLWRDYDDEWIRAVLRQQLPAGFPTRIAQYELFDLQTGKRSLLLNAPVSSAPTPVIWSPDSRSLVLSGVHLPLDVSDPREREARRVHTYVVEIRLLAHAVSVVTDESLVPVAWHSAGAVVSFRRSGEKQCEGGQQASVWYEKAADGWKRRDSDVPVVIEACPNVTVEQSLNEPARIVMRDVHNSEVHTLFDLNSQFADLAFTRVERLRWPGGNGRFVEGGLYLPVGYVPGKKYPLVIQTHGFDPNAFWIEGPHTTAFAAQPLASRGIVVLQVNDIFYDSLVTPAELDRAMDAYESAIDELDKRGLIDPARVGLVGFSRTGMYVKYALTHSRKSFAAAVVADANDGGYLQYVLNEPFAPRIGAEMDAVFGAAPFGDGLQIWFQKSPGFRLDAVRTPVLIEALGPWSLLNEWEWFSGLKRLEKPVDLVYLPTGTHVLVKPWDRQVSMEASVDWLCFWLTGEEDPDPRKKAQYSRWREFQRSVPNN